VPAKLVNKFHKRAAAIPPLRILAEEDDATLVTAVKCGNTEAFEILVRRYQARILSVAWRFTRNREDAEDVTQQAFQKAFVHFRQFEGNSSFSTWLTRIAMNEALMWLRRKRALLEVPIEESGTTTDESALQLDFPDSGPSPEDSCLQRERERILAAAINELRPGMRAAIHLRGIGELSTEETARVMGLSVESVKGRVFHARKKLRERLTRYIPVRQRTPPNPRQASSFGSKPPIPLMLPRVPTTPSGFVARRCLGNTRIGLRRTQVRKERSRI
jgi:RNA polymerase sigma-70 factor (ECF subfamily)